MEISDLNELEQKSIQRNIPIIGSEKGEWLLNKIKELKPKRILELGTANGYSGIILGSEGAELTTVDKDTRIVKEAMKNYSKFDVNAKILIGDAVEIVEDLVSKKEEFDLIFIDFEKKFYLDVLDNCITLVKNGGIIMADNINMAKCQEFKKVVMKHSKLQTVIIEIGDGLSYSVKI